jgi:hypothetical protein
VTFSCHSGRSCVVREAHLAPQQWHIWGPPR